MEALQALKTTIENMLVITRKEADRPVDMDGNMWGIGYAKGIRAGYHSQATCLTMLLEVVEMEIEKQAEPGLTDMADMSQIVPNALAEIKVKMDAEKQRENPNSPITALRDLPRWRYFFDHAKTSQPA